MPVLPQQKVGKGAGLLHPRFFLPVHRGNDMAVIIHQTNNPSNKVTVAAVQSAGALLLFLLTYWYFYSFGATDLALAPPFDDIYPLLMVLPYLCCPFFILIVHKLGSRALQWVKLVLIATASVVFMVDQSIAASNPVFSSRWTWAYNDLRELNYLSPALNIVGYMAVACLFFVSSHELLITIKDPGEKITIPLAGKAIGIVLVGLIGFGICQEILGRQPVWVSLSSIALLAAGECAVILFSSWQSWRFARTVGPDDDRSEMEPRLTFAQRLRIKPFKGYIFIGLAAWCMFVALYPAQLAFQEGPSNPWGTSVIVGAVVSMFLLVLWWRYQLPPLASFLTITIVSIISPVMLVLGATVIPGFINAAQFFSLAGFESTLAWILYHGILNRARWSPKHTLLATWTWGAWFVVFFHDPLLEIWEMEEALLKLQARAGHVTDPLGTGVGLYYPLLLAIAIAGVACAAGLLAIEIIVKRLQKGRHAAGPGMVVPSTSTQQAASRRLEHERFTPVATRKTQFYALLAVVGVVLSGSIVLTRENVTRNAPVILADMGDHGVLWLANSHDRVLPDYHPDFSTSPRNSTVTVHAMKGEAELVQLVFSPIASKMISFNGYWWSSSAGARGDNKWRSSNGSVVQIPVTSGQVGYINCFNPRIADVLLPWTSFITGSGARQNIPFWLEIDVPRNVSAGLYTTEFEYLTTSYLQRSPRAASLKFTLQLDVWNITKPLNRTMDTCVGLYPENNANVDSLYKLAMQFGADPYSFGANVGQPFSPVVSYNFTSIVFNWTRFDARVQEMLEAGVNQIKLDFYPGIDCRNNAEAVLNGSKNNYLNLIRWFYENASVHLASKLTPWGTTWESETITQHSDEPDPRIDPLSPQAFDLVYKIVHDASQGKIRSMQTFMYEPAFDEWLDSLDIWVLTPDSFSVEVSNRIHSAGHEVWTYANGDNFPGTDFDLRTPLIMSRLRGWIGYRYNITGFLHWVFYWNYNDAGRSGCGYDGRGDGTEIVPHASGYLPTLRLAALRDGLEDNDLLWMLNKTVALAQALAISDPVVTQAIAALSDVDVALGRQQADLTWPLPAVTRAFNHAAQAYMTLRTRCGSLLDRLHALL